MNETQAYRLFVKQFEPSFSAKLHGNKFQSGLPDLIFAKDGKHAFMEFKIVTGDSLPWSKCRLGQHLTMMQMLKAGMPVWYIVYSLKTEAFYAISPEEVSEGARCDLTRGTKISSVRVLLELLRSTGQAGVPEVSGTHQ